MSLTLKNEFVVEAGIEQTWDLLLDLGRVAQCLPGASIDPADEHGVYAGSMRVKLGPVTMNYKGTARLTDVDPATHVASFRVSGRETRGGGTASATIRNELVEQGASTRVVVTSELDITGRPAQLGRGIMQDVAAAMLGDFASQLATMMAESSVAPLAPRQSDDQPSPDGAVLTSDSGPAGAAREPGSAPERLDLTEAVGGALRTRVAGAALLLLALTVIVRRLRR